MPQRMHAVVLKGHGGFDMLEYREDWPVPVPAAGEILIEVRACGLNNTDVNTRTAWYHPGVAGGTTPEGGAAGSGADVDVGAWGGWPLSFPRIQGADVAGRVAAVGEGVDTRRIGERVLIDPWLRDWSDPLNRDRAGFFGSERDGGYAQFACAPERNVVAIDSECSDQELATFPCAYVTAEHMLSRARLSAGERVLVTGASGGVGSALVQLAHRRGAEVLAVAGQDKHALLRGLGAARFFDRGADLPGAVQAATGGEGVHMVADVVGGATFTDLLHVLRRGGRYATAGAIAGPLVELDLRTLYLRDLELSGCTVPTPDVFEHLVGYIERAEIRPLLAGAHPLRDIVAAQSEFLAKRHVGNLVVVPPPP